MTPFGLTTIVDLAPRLVLPFSAALALWLELTGTLVLSILGMLIVWHRSVRDDVRAELARARRFAGGAVGRTTRPATLRSIAGGRAN